MSDPTSLLHELDILENEIKMRKEALKEFTERRNEIIRTVTLYMIENDVKEIPYKGKKFKVTEKISRPRKKPSEIRKDAIEAITELVDGPDIEEIYDKIKQSFHGEAKKVYTLKR